MRHFLDCLLLFATVLLAPHAKAAGTFHVFAPDGISQQLMCLKISIDTDDVVAIDQQDPFQLSFAPAGITWNASRQQLIVTSGGKQGSDVAVLSVNEDGRPSKIATGQLAHPSGYTSVDRTGNYFMTANYSSGVVAVYKLNVNGSIGDVTSQMTTPNKEAHCILTTRDNRSVYIPCVKNNNALYQYHFDASTGELRPMDPHNASPPAMFGPRHVAYHPTLPIAYFSNEQQLGVSVFQIESSGQLTDIQHATTIPRRSPFEQGKRDLHASDLAINSSGVLLFVAVRDFNGDEDSVFTFRIEPDGKLSQIARSKVGDVPWKIDMSPSGKHLLASESGEKKLTIYRIKPNGKLALAASTTWNAPVRNMVVVQR